MAIDQVEEAIGNGVCFSWLTFDEDYGNVPAFGFELDRLGQRGAGEVRSNFHVWPTRPACRSGQRVHASKRVDNVCRHSPVFTRKAWRRIKIKSTTRGPAVWEVKAGRVHLVDTSGPGKQSLPTDRLYWLMVARSTPTGEIKYFVSNAPRHVSLQVMMKVGFSRWQVEKWFERAKQEAGFGAFEVRTYTGLIRHWLCWRMAMYFLAAQTERLRGKNPRIPLEQVADVVNALAWKIWNRWPHSWSNLIAICAYYQDRNEASYASRRKTAMRADSS